MRLVVATCITIALVSATSDELGPQPSHECLMLGRKPFEPTRSLDFCKQHGVAWTCCNPIIDDEVALLFESFLTRGRACPFGIRGSTRQKQDEFMQWMCLTCDPSQGGYLDASGRLRVCSAFANRMFEGEGEVSNWNECGIRLPELCIENEDHPGKDRFECGDDPMFPLTPDWWANATEMMLSPNLRPFGLDDQAVVVVNEADLAVGEKCFNEGARNTPVVTMSLLSLMFYLSFIMW